MSKRERIAWSVALGVAMGISVPVGIYLLIADNRFAALPFGILGLLGGGVGWRMIWLGIKPPRSESSDRRP